MQATETKGQDQAIQTMVRVRPDTRRKIEHVADAKYWTLAEAFDQAADALLRREKMKSPVACAVK